MVGLCATPPDRVSVKSDVSRSPEPPDVLYTPSEKVTVSVVLLEDNTVEEIVGNGFKLVVLLDCEVDAALPAAS